MIKLIVASAILLLASSAHSYTFTSTTGSTFEGELVRVEADKVTIKRTSDKKVFSVDKTRFAAKDQEYFGRWAQENPKLNLPGIDVEHISLYCKSVRSESDIWVRKTGRTLVDIDISSDVYTTQNWIYVETTATAAVRDETERIKIKGRTIHVEASSLSGPVHARIYAVFFAKINGEPIIAEVDERNVLVDRGQGEFYSTCGAYPNYYGFGTVAVNLANGKLIGVDGSSHQIKQILTKKITSPSL